MDKTKVPSLNVHKTNKKTSIKGALFLYIFYSRTNRFAFLGKLRGSMALEGSLVLPMFLFFMMTVLLGLEAVRFQSDVQEALHQAGNRAAFEGYLEKYAGREGIGSGRWVREYLDDQLYPYLCVSDGREGVLIKEISAAEGNGQIELLAEYSLKPFISWFPIGTIKIQDRFFSHLWVGYCGGGGQNNREKEIYVYITKTGKRYHLSYQCTHLGIQPSAINYGEIEVLRNTSGGKYYACNRCRPAKGGIVYITEEGSSYHGQSDCPALKRTVSMIPLSEAAGYGACNKCAS